MRERLKMPLGFLPYVSRYMVRSLFKVKNRVRNWLKEEDG